MKKNENVVNYPCHDIKVLNFEESVGYRPSIWETSLNEAEAKYKNDKSVEESYMPNLLDLARLGIKLAAEKRAAQWEVSENCQVGDILLISSDAGLIKNLMAALKKRMSHLELRIDPLVSHFEGEELSSLILFKKISDNLLWTRGFVDGWVKHEREV